MKRTWRALLFGLLLAVAVGMGIAGCGDDRSEPGVLAPADRQATEDTAGRNGAGARGAHTTSDD